MHLSPATLESAIRLLEPPRPAHEAHGADPRGDISNDIGEVKRHVARSGRRSRLSTSQESAEAAVAQAVSVWPVHTSTLAGLLTTSLPVLPTKHLFGHGGP